MEITQDPPISTLENLEQPPAPSSQQESPPTPTPPTPTPIVSATDPAYIKLLEDTTREQNRRIQELERRSAAPPEPAKPVLTKEQLRERFYDDPMGTNREMIREELAATIGPIQEFVSQFRGQSAIDKLVNTFKVNPKFASNWSPEVEDYVRNQAAGIHPSQLNDNAFTFIVASAIGLRASGMLGTPSAPPSPAPAPVTQPSPTDRTVPTPPYMRPSAPPGPSNQTNQQAGYAPLNENEKRILREFNASKPRDKQMTESQFREWQDMPSSDVAHTQFDKPKPAGK